MRALIYLLILGSLAEDCVLGTIELSVIYQANSKSICVSQLHVIDLTDYHLCSWMIVMIMCEVCYETKLFIFKIINFIHSIRHTAKLLDHHKLEVHSSQSPCPEPEDPTNLHFL